MFFPGDRLMDDLWHALIIETADYRLLCHKLKNGNFIDHSELKYNDYTRTKGAHELHEEQFSWLASYIANFGDISEESYQHLLLAQSLADRLSVTREKLNQIGQELIKNANLQLSSQSR